MTSIHNPTITVTLRDGSVEIRELLWPDAMELYKRLKDQLQRYLTENGSVKLDAVTIASVLSENIELGTWLVLKSTGKDAGWLSARSLSEVLDVAGEAAALNVGVIVDHIKKFKSRLVQAVAGAASQIPNSSAIGSTPASPTKPSS